MNHICHLLIFFLITHQATTQASDMRVNLEVEPRAALTGEAICLNCLVNGQKMKGYFRWYRNEDIIHGQYKYVYIITKVVITDEASYRCEHRIDDSKGISSEIHVTVTDRDVALQVDPPSVLEGGVLNLNCRYRKNYLSKDADFYKDNRRIHSMKLSKQGALHSIRVNSSKDSGSYHCNIHNTNSRNVHVHVHEIFSKPILTADPGAHLFEGQQIKLACLVEIFRSNSSLSYLYYKDGQALNSAADRNYYIKETSRLDDSGIYLCEAIHLNSEVKKLSNQVLVSVKRIPVSKPELAISPGNKLIEGDTASLTCSVSNGSTPIIFILYKFPNNELYREESNLTDITYQIFKVNESTDGNYSCGVSNEAAGPPLQSHSVAVSVLVPVEGASLTSNTSKPGTSAGDRLVLHCQVKRGTATHFRWYLNNQQLENNSESYHLNTERSELIINSFQIGLGGRYHCVATNRGTYEGIFNTTSNYIDVSLPARSHSIAITASVLPLFLTAALIAVVVFKLQKKNQYNPSNDSQPQGVITGDRALPPSDETSASNYEYAVVESARSAASSYEQVTYSVVQATKPMEEYPKTAADLVYSEVTISNSRDYDNDAGASGRKQNNKNYPSDYCITYATVIRASNGASLDGGPMDEGCVYENLLRT